MLYVINLFIVVMLVISSGCDYKDSSEPIVGDYYFNINSKNSRNIVFYKSGDKASKTLVPDTVEQYFLWDNYILASTRKREKNEQGVVIKIDGCKFWVINTRNQEVDGPYRYKEFTNISPWKLLNKSSSKKKLLQRNLPCPLVM